MVNTAKKEFIKLEESFVSKEVFYRPYKDEIELFEKAFENRLPVLLKGPTGTGKTRFIEHMAFRLLSKKELPLITVSCHEDLSASDLVGRYLLDANGTHWVDGPLTKAVRSGGICYLDEVVEARKDTTVLIHSLTDYRRSLSIDKRGEVVKAHEDFMLVVSYNPGYQSVIKNMKHSTKQRFIAIEFNFPTIPEETEIIAFEAKVDKKLAEDLARLGAKLRTLIGDTVEEAASTRSLIYAAKLVKANVAPRRACEVAISWVLSDEKASQEVVKELVNTIFE